LTEHQNVKLLQPSDADLPKMKADGNDLIDCLIVCKCSTWKRRLLRQFSSLSWKTHSLLQRVQASLGIKIWAEIHELDWPVRWPLWQRCSFMETSFKSNQKLSPAASSGSIPVGLAVPHTPTARGPWCIFEICC
jgi:hypothetical protein